MPIGPALLWAPLYLVVTAWLWLMSVAGLLQKHPDPTSEQLEESITGNLCRCTGYASIRRAAHRAAELSSPHVGKSGPRGRDGAP